MADGDQAARTGIPPFTRNDLHLPPAAFTVPDVDAEHAPEPLRPRHGPIPLDRASLGGRTPIGAFALSPGAVDNHT